MLHLYVDNFRGFEKTTISLSKVNFLVGENSTGKSSILGLLNLFCTASFWTSHDFNCGKHEFGTFGDLISTKNISERHFSIGFSIIIVFKDKDLKDKKPSEISYLMRYEEEDALPKLSYAGRIFEGYFIGIKRFKSTYKYILRKLPEGTSYSTKNHLFDYLDKQFHLPDSDFESEVASYLLSAASLFMALTMIQEYRINPDPKSADSIFSFDHFPIKPIWFAPIRTKPKRTYDTNNLGFNPEGEHTPYLLRKLIPSKKSKRNDVNQFVETLKRFGSLSGLYNDVLIKNFKNNPDSPFEIRIKLRKNNSPRISSVGYGVSQSLPLIVEMISRESGSWFLIQQPEVHLHPRAQAALGDLVFQLSESENKRFLIETHSDYTIDRFRLNLRRKKDSNSPAQILFFERTQTGNSVKTIPISESGKISDDQPASYRDFFLREQLNLLDL